MSHHSTTGNVTKFCGCVKWKECAHPWYVDFQEGQHRYRRSLDALLERHPVDFAEARAEARRAIVTWRGRLLPGDRPTLGELMTDYGRREGAPAAEKYHVDVITRARVDGRTFGAWCAADITTTALERFRLDRPKVAANRN